MNKKFNKNYEKSLPEVFKELKEEQIRQAQMQLLDNEINSTKNIFNFKNKTKKSKEYSYMNDTYSNNFRATNSPRRFNEVGAIIGILFVILFTTTIKSNYIFATSEQEEKKVIGAFEDNKEPIDLMEIVSENISEVVKKEIATEEQTIQKEIEYIENNQLPKDEQVVVQEGFDGKKEVTYIRSYQENELVDEKIINDVLITEPVKSIIQVGTSEYLSTKNVHIGDTMYTKDETQMMLEPDENSIQICKIYAYIDVKLEEIDDKWCKITVDGLEGYVYSDYLTSEFETPGVAEKSRIQRILVGVNFDMPINEQSGLTKEDFTKIFSNNVRDLNKIFENNAELFYEIEQKYNINAIFLAAIGIHESDWGTSTIANEKKNLFGYGAYDSSPYASSYTFESYEYGIELLAKVLSKYYINEPGTAIYDGETAIGSYYNGPTVSGVNVRYASDENWKNRVFEVMTELYKKLRQDI